MRLDRSSLLFGVVFVLAGAAFLLESLGVWRVDTWDLLPVLLIGGGLALAGSALDRRQPR